MRWLAECSVREVRAALRSGIPLPDHRAPPEWVEDLSERFAALGIDP